MRVEQAVYGEVDGGGHGLRACSSDQVFAREIAARLDLPDTLPAGITGWSPFVRGFPVGDRYVVARTFRDPAASRGGMVQTHALIVGLDDVCRLENLAPLFNSLPAALADVAPLGTLELEPVPLDAPPACADLVGTANSLLRQGTGPVVRVGIEDFERLISALWRNLWPSVRSSFVFGLSFGPADVVHKPLPTIVCTPEQLRGRWAAFRVVVPSDDKPESEAAALLAGSHGTTQLLDLAASLGISLQTIGHLRQLETVHKLLTSSDRFDSLSNAVRMVGVLSVGSDQGKEAKEALLARFIGQVNHATRQQVLTLRNLQLTAFAGAMHFWEAVQRRVERLPLSSSDDDDAVEMIGSTSDDTRALGPWQEAAREALAAVLHLKTTTAADAAWRWLDRDAETTVAVISLVPNEAGVEQPFAATAPRQLKAATSQALLPSLLSRGWLSAHGAVLSASQMPLEAARRQLQVDTTRGHADGVRLALRLASTAQLVECAIALDDSRVLDLCANALAADPVPLRSLSFGQIPEQRVWRAGLQKKSSLWSAPAEPAHARDTVLSNLLADVPVDAQLLNELSKTPLADVSEYSRRAELWRRLPARSRDGFLRATAKAWLDAAVGSSALDAPEDVLESEILAHAGLTSVLGNQHIDLVKRLAIISALPGFTEHRFAGWLQTQMTMGQRLTPNAAEALGRLMLARQWKATVRDLASRYGVTRADLHPTFHACAVMLSIFDRWKLPISPPTSAEKWAAFIDVASHLYSDGPGHNELWSRAGGDNAELPYGATGRARWQAAISYVRNGAHPSMRELITAMRIEHPRNEELAVFASDPDIVGKRRYF